MGQNMGTNRCFMQKVYECIKTHLDKPDWCKLCSFQHHNWYWYPHRAISSKSPSLLDTVIAVWWVFITFLGDSYWTQYSQSSLHKYEEHQNTDSSTDLSCKWELKCYLTSFVMQWDSHKKQQLFITMVHISNSFSMHAQNFLELVQANISAGLFNDTFSFQ